MASHKELSKSSSSVFKEFYSKLQDPKSEEIRQLFERFVQKGFKTKASREEMSKQIREIVELMFENFADVWKIRSKIILEGMEALVTKNLYKLIRLRREPEILENEILEKKMKVIGSFIKPEHLDIDPKRLSSLRIERAISELTKMNKFKTPRDKMVLIMNAWKVVGLMLKETAKPGSPDGADMFFPSIIYILLKGAPKDVKANIDFIKLYRNPELLDSEDDYFITTLTSAIEFIGNMIGDDLNIEKSEYSDLYNKFSDERDREFQEDAERRAHHRNEQGYDDYENQSDISIMTTQTSAQLIGELQSLDVPVYATSLKLNKGIQTESSYEESKSSKDGSLNTVSTKDSHKSNHSLKNNNQLKRKIEKEIFHENDVFWTKNLSEDLNNMTILYNLYWILESSILFFESWSITILIKFLSI